MAIENFWIGFKLWKHSLTMCVLEIQQVKLVGYKLKGRASAWYKQLQLNQMREHKEYVMIWQQMKQLLKAMFLFSNYEQILYQQFHHFQQRNRFINEYEDEFFRLSDRNNLHETKWQQVTRIIAGLT